MSNPPAPCPGGGPGGNRGPVFVALISGIAGFTGCPGGGPCGSLGPVDVPVLISETPCGMGVGWGVG